MKDNRLASEVLLSIELEVKQHTQYLKNITMLLKNLANRYSASEIKKVPELNTPIKTQEAKQESTIPGLKTGVVFKDGKLVKQSEKKEEYSFDEQPGQIEVATEIVGQRRDLRYPDQPVQERKTPIQQRILYKDGKPVTLAKIEVLDAAGHVIWGGKTNNMGKWNQLLVPGTYTINVLRKGTATKPPVEISYTIDVPKSIQPVQLPDVES